MFFCVGGCWAACWHFLSLGGLLVFSISTNSISISTKLMRSGFGAENTRHHRSSTIYLLSLTLSFQPPPPPSHSPHSAFDGLDKDVEGGVYTVAIKGPVTDVAGNQMISPSSATFL